LVEVRQPAAPNTCVRGGQRDVDSSDGSWYNPDSGSRAQTPKKTFVDSSIGVTQESVKLDVHLLSARQPTEVGSYPKLLHKKHTRQPKKRVVKLQQDVPHLRRRRHGLVSERNGTRLT
jgi:hypothetical protein